MKRLLSILLIGALSASLLTGCSAKNDTANKGNATKTNKEASKPKEEKTEYTLKDEVLVDNESYTVTVKNAEEYKDDKGTTGIRLNVSMTNKTEESLILDNIIASYINGYSGYLSWDSDSEYAYCSPEMIELNKMIDSDTISGIEVPGGKTVEVFCEGYLQDYMGNVADEITFRLSVQRKDGAISIEETKEKFYSIYPTGKTADTVEYPEPDKVKGEKLIDDNEFFKLIFQENKLEKDGSTKITYYAENKSADPLSLNMTNIKVNGKSVRTGQNMYFLKVGYGLNSGKREIDHFTFQEYDTGYTPGEEIKELSFILSVEEQNSVVYEAEYTVTF